MHDLGKTVWLWTGFVWEDFDHIKMSLNKALIKTLLYNCDVVVDGPFKMELSDRMLKWRGSANQRVIDVQKTLRQRKSSYTKVDTMNEKIEFRCPKCGKLLDGITLDYRLEWLCSKCTEDQSDVLHCERGCKVKAVDLDAGLSCDSKQAHELLTEGQVYEVEKIHVGGWCSSIRLKEFPGKEFNTVHFIRYELGGNMETVEILAVVNLPMP